MTEPHGPEQTDSSPLSGEVADDSVNTEWVNDGEEVAPAAARAAPRRGRRG